MYALGIVCGRFQPLHIGHMKYISHALVVCEHLLVGITNPDPGLTAPDRASRHRSLATSNPFTYYERYMMVKSALLESGLQREQYDIVPFPINFPDRLHNYVPMNAHFFINVFDEWGYRKVELLRSQGIANIAVRVFEESAKPTSGSEIRSLILADGDWEQFVPSAVSTIIREIGVESVKERMFKTKDQECDGH